MAYFRRKNKSVSINVLQVLKGLPGKKNNLVEIKQYIMKKQQEYAVLNLNKIDNLHNVQHQPGKATQQRF